LRSEPARGGAPAFPEVTAGKEHSFLQQLTRGGKISISGVALALLLFFFPWVDISCGGQKVISLSGWNLAMGTGMPERGSAQPIFWLVPLGAVVILLLLHFVSTGKLRRQKGRGWLTLAAVVPTLVLVLKYFQMKSEAQKAGLGVDFTFWYLCTLLAFVVAAVGANLDRSPRPRSDTS
jgi:hypothetical protein